MTQGKMAPGASVSAPAALGSVEDLRKSAGWERMAEADRAKLLAGFVPYPAEAAGGASGALTLSAQIALERWIAGLIAPAFQAESAQIVRGWLEDASPAASLFVGGSYGQGRTSLVAALARETMAKRPAATDYCYVPDPSALDQAHLLAIPLGLGKEFAGTIDRSLRALTGAWDTSESEGDEDSGQQSGGEPSSGASAGSDASEAGDGRDGRGGADAQPAAQPAAQHGPTRSDLVALVFEPLDDAKFEPLRPYITRLRATFDTLAAADTPLPVTYDDLATWLVKGAAGQNGSGAPVIVGTLAREKLDELLLRANGGVLVLPAADVLGVDGAWPALSVALASRTMSIKSTWPPLPLTARVALIGDGPTYNALATTSGGFTRLFRYEAWINSTTAWTPQAEATYAALADGVARFHSLPAFDPSGVAKLVEEASRRGDGLNRSYLIADLVVMRDIAVEAGRAAVARGASATSGADILSAMGWRKRLQSAAATRTREAILSGQANTPTTGAAIGQINGLGVYEFHPPEGNFAVPTRISATVSAGRDERLLDIEREAEQADADHVRGEMTIEGYLANRYGQQRPLNLVARIRFEQEHGTTGGDSASGAILFALLSALAQVPIQFSRAVTGAVGQYGELQPIGGVNTKIEGFWTLCKARRERGEQSPGGYGVIIPAANTRDLMLPDEVAEAIIQEGWFHIWPVSTVDQALAVLTGVPTADIHARVDKRFQQFHQAGMQGSR